MSRAAARVGAVGSVRGVEIMGAALRLALEEQLRGESHGPVMVNVVPGKVEATAIMDTIGVDPDSPARRFFEEHPDGFLVVASAETDVVTVATPRLLD